MFGIRQLVPFAQTDYHDMMIQDGWIVIIVIAASAEFGISGRHSIGRETLKGMQILTFD